MESAYPLLLVLGLMLVSSFVVFSFAQSNEASSSDDTISGEITSNESSFSTWSRELANQSESGSESDEGDEQD